MPGELPTETIEKPIRKKEPMSEFDITDQDLGGSCKNLKEQIETIIPFWTENPNIIFNNDWYTAYIKSFPCSVTIYSISTWR